jgi:hypothetical protein
MLQSTHDTIQYNTIQYKSAEYVHARPAETRTHALENLPLTMTIPKANT